MTTAQECIEKTPEKKGTKKIFKAAHKTAQKKENKGHQTLKEAEATTKLQLLFLSFFCSTFFQTIFFLLSSQFFSIISKKIFGDNFGSLNFWWEQKETNNWNGCDLDSLWPVSFLLKNEIKVGNNMKKK